MLVDNTTFAAITLSFKVHGATIRLIKYKYMPKRYTGQSQYTTHCYTVESTAVHCFVKTQTFFPTKHIVIIWLYIK